MCYLFIYLSPYDQGLSVQAVFPGLEHYLAHNRGSGNMESMNKITKMSLSKDDFAGTLIQVIGFPTASQFAFIWWVHERF